MLNTLYGACACVGARVCVRVCVRDWGLSWRGWCVGVRVCVWVRVRVRENAYMRLWVDGVWVCVCGCGCVCVCVRMRTCACGYACDIDRWGRLRVCDCVGRWRRTCVS